MTTGETEALSDENSVPKVARVPEKLAFNRRFDKDLDKGWAWVTLGATFLSFFIMQGQVLTSNIYFIIYLQEFEQPRSIAAFVGATYSAAINLSGPVASVLLGKFGARTVLMLGGFFMATGFLCVFPSTNIVHVIVACGIIRGIGGGFIMSGCQAALSKYFEKRLYVATGIMYSASAIGMMTVGLLTEYIIDLYGWRGSMIIQAGLALHICVCGAVVYRLPKEPPSEDSTTPSAKKAKFPAQRYMSDPRFWCISACTMLFFMFTAIVIMFWKDILPVKEHFKIAVVAMAVGSTIGRATAGMVSNRIPPPIHNCIVALSGSMVILVFLVSDRVWIVAVQNFAWGFFNGQHTVADRLQLAWVYGRLEMPIVLGYSLIFVGIGCFLAPPLGGLIRDMTGNYTATLLMASSFLIIGASLSITLYFLHKRHLKNVYELKTTENRNDTINAVELQNLSCK